MVPVSATCGSYAAVPLRRVLPQAVQDRAEAECKTRVAVAIDQVRPQLRDVRVCLRLQMRDRGQALRIIRVCRGALPRSSDVLLLDKTGRVVDQETASACAASRWRSSTRRYSPISASSVARHGAVGSGGWISVQMASASKLRSSCLSRMYQ